jgi:ribonuclease D
MSDAAAVTPAEDSEPDEATQPESTAIPLLTPEGGVPAVIDTPEALARVVEAFGAATGPVAADAERASGFRYGQATYLAQFKREGAGIALIDTAALPDLSSLNEALGDAEYVFHAASQDLPGMHDLGIHPHRIFDTELAARLLGWPKVGLAAVVEHELGLALTKEHSAQDWSVRPLPHEWLVYAALDVEKLIEVRNGLAARLDAAGKSEWAAQEFEAVRLTPPAEAKVEPWRRVSGSHLMRDARSLAIVRSLWEARDKEARRRDMSPGRVLRDAAIASAALAKPASLNALMEVREWSSRGTKRAAPRWYPAIEEAMALPESALPARRAAPGDGPPQPRMWKEKRPEAAARLDAARAVIADMSALHEVPAENLLQPDALRRACWEYTDGGVDWVRDFLSGRGARAWQLELLAQPLAEALANAKPTEVPTATQ